MRSILIVVYSMLMTTVIKAEHLDVVVGWDKPPYVIAANHSGFELDLIRAILADAGHNLSPIYVPFGRTARLLKDDAVDVGLTLLPTHNVAFEILSEPYITYQNVAVTRADRKLKIDSIADLKGKSIIAFQTAQTVLGSEFGEIMSAQPSYIEMAMQERQVDMLMLGSVDVIVLDRNIFNYFKGLKDKYANDKTVFHELFPSTSYRAAIPDPTLRLKFNKALQNFIQDGRYQALLDSYNLENLHFATSQ